MNAFEVQINYETNIIRQAREKYLNICILVAIHIVIEVYILTK